MYCTAITLSSVKTTVTHFFGSVLRQDYISDETSEVNVLTFYFEFVCVCVYIHSITSHAVNPQGPA